MQSPAHQISDVIYNAASQQFEALVTIHGDDQSHRYPCAIDAPISMPFEAAASALSRQAARLHESATGLRSAFPVKVRKTRANRPSLWQLLQLDSMLMSRGRAA